MDLGYKTGFARKLLASIVLTLAGLPSAMAQYTFTISASMSGNCAGYTGQMNQMLSQFKSQAISGFPTRELCEETRALCHQELGHIELLWIDPRTGKVVKREATNCKLNVSTTPCTGRDMTANSGSVNVLGVSKGTSFYSTTPADEIKNWSDDYIKQMVALFGDKLPDFKLTRVNTGDEEYDDARSTRGGNFHATSSAPYIGDGIFKGIPNTPLIEANSFGQANIDNVNRYLEKSQGLGAAYIANPQELSLMLQRQFQSLTCSEANPLGFDVNEIINKTNRTEAEKQALADYNEYAKRMCDQMASEIDTQMGRMDKSAEKKEIDMAIIAKDCYGDDDKGYLQMTDYRRISSDNINDSYMKSIAEAIELCNATHDETGFNAVLYKNEKTGAYVIGCEGSSIPSFEVGSKFYPSIEKDEETGAVTLSLPLAGGLVSATFSQDNINDWGLNNIIQGFGGTIAQYELAQTIGKSINMLPKDIRDNLDISITGHSLGGGIASIIGLETGMPTYTYNAEGVSNVILNRYGLLEKKQKEEYDITAYHSSTDPLTITQKGAQALTSIQSLIGVTNKTGTITDNFAARAIGKEVNIGAQGFHPSGPLVDYFLNKHSEKQSEWERIRYSRNSILAAKQDGSLQKIDHINILIE